MRDGGGKAYDEGKRDADDAVIGVRLVREYEGREEGGRESEGREEGGSEEGGKE